MTMTKGEDSQNLDDKNKEKSQDEILAALKAQGDKIAELQAKLNERSLSNGGSGVTPADIMKLAEALSKRPKDDINYQDGIFLEQVPEEDYLEQENWVRFCVPCGGYALADDIRKGHIIKLPYGKKTIWFDFLLLNRRAVGKHTATIPIASYTSKSKAEVEWIRNHSKFGTFIFEDMGAVSNTTAEKALRLGRILEMINGMDYPVVVNMATRDYGLKFNTNPEDLKRDLAYAMCDREFKADELRTENIAKESYKSALLLGRS